MYRTFSNRRRRTPRARGLSLLPPLVPRKMAETVDGACDRLGESPGHSPKGSNLKSSCCVRVEEAVEEAGETDIVPAQEEEGSTPKHGSVAQRQHPFKEAAKTCVQEREDVGGTQDEDHIVGDSVGKKDAMGRIAARLGDCLDANGENNINTQRRLSSGIDDGSVAAVVATAPMMNAVIADDSNRCSSKPTGGSNSSSDYHELPINRSMALNPGSSDNQGLPSSSGVSFVSKAPPLVHFAATAPSGSKGTPREAQHSEVCNRRKRIGFFPKRLMDMLLDESLKGSVVQWRLNGLGFEVVSQRRFTIEFIPKFFSRPTQFASFVRKLYMWGFRKMTTPEVTAANGTFTGRHHEVFYHALFRRDQPHLCMQMVLEVSAKRGRKRKRQNADHAHQQEDDDGA